MSSRTAEAPLRLLHLEDSELDHALMLLHLQRGGLRVESQRVDSEADFLLALEQSLGRDRLRLQPAGLLRTWSRSIC
jgi:hypothetical protein